MRRLCIILLWLVSLPGLECLRAQPSSIDSLKTLLEKTSDEKKRVDILNELASDVFDNDSEIGFDYASQAAKIARDHNYLQGLQSALTLQGYYFYGKGKYADAMRYFSATAKIPIPKNPEYAYMLVMKGNLYRVVAKYDSAEISYNAAIKLIDSLKTQSWLAFAYKNLGRLYSLQWKNEDAINAFNKALETYKRNGKRSGVADTWFSLAEVTKNNSDFRTAEIFTRKGCELANQGIDDLEVLNCKIANASILNGLGEYPEALKSYTEAMGILKSKDMPQLVATVYGGIADVYRALGQYDFALKYYTEALKIAERIDLQHEAARIYGSIAFVYHNQQNPEKAYEFMERSMQLRLSLKDEHGLSFCYNLKGLIEYTQKNFPEAIESINEALAIRRKIRSLDGVASSLFNLSMIYAETGQVSKALTIQQEALSISEEVGNQFTTGFSYNRLGSIYNSLKQYNKASEYLRKAERIALNIESEYLLMENHLAWSRLYEAQGNAALAFKRFKQYKTASDNLFSSIETQKLAELQALYLLERKDFEIELLKQERIIQNNEIQLQRSRINHQNVIIISIIVGMVLISVLALVTHRLNRKIRKANREIYEQKEEIQAQSEELVDANQTIAEINKKLEEKIEARTEALRQAYKELDTFFYRSSHDFRRPLTTFLGLAEVAKVTVKDPTALELFDKVRDTASNLDKMLVKLQSISDVGSQQFVYKEVMLKEIFETVCDIFRDEIQKKNITTSYDIQLNEPFISYPAMVRIIIENLVENALNFSGVNKPFIRLTARKSGDYLTLEIQDNGQGISPEYHDQIFDMYFRANERSKGNGLGLYIVKKAVEKLDGAITLSSILQVGTTFTIMLPSNRS